MYFIHVFYTMCGLRTDARYIMCGVFVKSYAICTIRNGNNSLRAAHGRDAHILS